MGVNAVRIRVCGGVAHGCGSILAGLVGVSGGEVWESEGFVGVPDYLEVPSFCARCHSDPAYMREHNPALPHSGFGQSHLLGRPSFDSLVFDYLNRLHWSCSPAEPAGIRP